MANAAPTPSVFRSRFIAIGLVSTFVRLATLGATGVFSTERLAWFALSVPAVVIGIGLGMWIHSLLSPPSFRLVIAAAVLAGGISGAVDAGVKLFGP